MSGYAGTPRFPAVEAHKEHRVRSLTLDHRPNVPPPPDHRVIWLVSMRFRLRPRTFRLRIKVRTPHQAILPWAHYRMIDPLGQNQNARWKHRAILPWAHYRMIDPLGQNQNARWKHRAILPWSRYRMIDPLGQNQNARWKDSSCDTGHNARLATKGSVQQSSVNRPVYSEHVPVTPGPGSSPMTGTRYWDPVPGARFHQPHQVNRMQRPLRSHRVGSAVISQPTSAL